VTWSQGIVVLMCSNNFINTEYILTNYPYIYTGVRRHIKEAFRKKWNGNNKLMLFVETTIGVNQSADLYMMIRT
jgi:hypothetical protein